MKRNNKKGFTIVELTIVIAVIAILAAVLIPTFSSVVDKANQSADIQLIRQANVVLQAATADGSSLSEKDAIKELENNSIKLDKPSQTDCVFYYIEDENRYVIFNTKTKKATYPEDLAKTLGDNWLPTYNLTYNYNVNYQFAKPTDPGFERIDTGFTIDWNKNFEVSMEFKFDENVDSSNNLGLLFGTWCTTESQNPISVLLQNYNPKNKQALLNVSVPHASNITTNVPYETGKKATLIFRWNKDQSVEITWTFENETPVVISGKISRTGSTDKSICIGTNDYRADSIFAKIDISSFKITTQYVYGDTVDNPNATGNANGYKSATWDKSVTSTTTGDQTITATWSN